MRAVLYWLAVLTVSLALVMALILVLESRDRGTIGAEAADRRWTLRTPAMRARAAATHRHAHRPIRFGEVEYAFH